MAGPNLQLDINDKNEIIHIRGINGARKTVIAELNPETKTIYWADAETQWQYRKSVEAFLSAEKIPIRTVLLKGQKPDVIRPKAPPRPPLHKMQGSLTPANVDWMYKWAPIEFQNTLGVEVRKLADGENPPADPRDLWVRADVIRTESRPVEETHGGQYISIRFKAKDQIIARARTHLTFERKEIFRGDTALDQAEPYEDRYTPKALELMEKRGEIELVWRRNSPASAGSSV